MDRCEALRRLMTDTTVNVLTAASLLGIAKDSAYAAVKSGEIPSIKLGSKHRVPTAPLRKMLGLPNAAPNTEAA